MTIESSFSYPSDLNASYPAAGDSIPEGDDHIRGVKNVLKTTLPNVSGAITPTHTELNFVDGVTSAIQTQFDLKAALAGPTFTGTVVLPSTTSIGTVSATEIGYLDGVTSAVQTQFAAKAALASPALTGTPTAPTASVGTGTTQIATTAFVAATALVSALPGQATHAGGTVTTDGTNASWADLASQAEMEAGNETATRAMSPLRVGQAIDAIAAGPLTTHINDTASAHAASAIANTPAGTISATTVQAAIDELATEKQAAISAATQAEQEAGSSTAVYVTPYRQQFHPSAAKVWIKCNAAGAIQASYNVASITDAGPGVVTVTIATDFSSASYAAVAQASGPGEIGIASQAAGSFDLMGYSSAGSAQDMTNYYAVAFGDQA